MKYFKKIFAVITALLIVLSLASCKGGDTTTTTGSEIENAPTVAPVEVPDPDRGENKVKIAATKYDYPFRKLSIDRSYAYEVSEIGVSPSQAADKLLKNQVSIASLSLEETAKVASQADVKILAVTSELKLSLITKGTEKIDIHSLEGKTVYCGNDGMAYIQQVIEKIFSDNGVNANLVFLSNSEAGAKIKNGEAEYCIMQDPDSVFAISGTDYIRAFELTGYWEEDYPLIDRCIVARTDFVNANPEIIKEFMAHIETCSNTILTEAGMISTVVDFISNGFFEDKDLTMSAVNSSEIAFYEKEELRNAVTKNYQFIGSEYSVPSDSAFYMG